MIHFISSCDILVHRSWLYLLFTVTSVHRCQVIAQASCHAVQCFKASDLPFTLATGPSSQVLSWSCPPSHMTPCHVTYAISSFFDMCTCGLISCVSHCGGYNPGYPQDDTWATPLGLVQPIRLRPTVLGTGQRAMQGNKKKSWWWRKIWLDMLDIVFLINTYHVTD
jgi:hypothetical protein